MPQDGLPINIQIISDLHLEIERQGVAEGQEFYHEHTEPRPPVLALLGDTGCTAHDKLFEWLLMELAQYETVLYVSGNHEPYYSTIAESNDRLKAFAKEHASPDPSRGLGRFVYLFQSRYDLNGTNTILGCTLWSRLDPSWSDVIAQSLNDFRRIKSFTPDDYSRCHETDLAWLNDTVASIAASEPHRKLIVFTHHAPATIGTSDSRFAGQPTNSCFATDLQDQPCWNPAVVKLWAFGHTHYSCDAVHEGIRLYANQRGYRAGEGTYDGCKVVNI